MSTISAGSSRTYTAQTDGATFSVSTSGGTIGWISGAASAQIGPEAMRRTFGPFLAGDKLTVFVQLGQADVAAGDQSPDGAPLTYGPDGKQNPLWLPFTGPRGRNTPVMRVHNASRTSSGGLSNRTYNTIWKAPCDEFYWVRLILKSLETTPYTIDAAAIAVTNTAKTDAERITPSVGNTLTNDSSTGWVQATFGGAASISLPARLSATRPSISYSDWMRVKSIAPVDGSLHPYLMARTYISGSAFSFATVDPSYADNPNANIFQYNYLQNVAGGAIATPSSFTSTTQDFNTPMFGFEVMASRRSLNLMFNGDSITQGQSRNTSQITSWAAYGCEALRRTGKQVSYINAGWAGQTSAVYQAFGKDLLASMLPDYLFYSVYTPNDGALTQSIADTQFALALDMAQYCYSLNVTPVLTFIAPNNNLDATQDGLRKALITKCKNSGFLVCDLTPSLGDGAYPERYRSGLNYDALHPSEGDFGGHGVAGAYFADWAAQNLQFPT